MRCDSVSEANVRSTQLSSGADDGVGSEGIGVGGAVGVGLGVGVGESVGLLVADGDVTVVGEGAAGANRQPEMSVANSTSTSTGLVRRARSKGVTTASTRQRSETCMAPETLARLRTRRV